MIKQQEIESRHVLKFPESLIMIYDHQYSIDLRMNVYYLNNK